MAPITNLTVHKQVLNQIMVAYLNDNEQSWIMNKNGNYNRLIVKNYAQSAHDYFMSNPSLSGRGKAIIKNKPKEIKLRK